MVDMWFLRKRKVRTMKTPKETVDSVIDNSDATLLGAMPQVLDRDQRTCAPRVINYDDMRVVKVINECEFSIKTNISDNFNNSKNSLTHRQNHQNRHQRRAAPWNHRTKWSSYRLGELVVIGAFLLSIISPAMSAPTSPTHQRPKWINPCGLGSSDDIDSELVDLGLRLNDQELLSQIVVQAKNALMHADLFKDEYVKNTFNLDFLQHHESWKKNHYEWLPSETDIPKRLGEPVPEQHLMGLELDQVLKDSYTYMQKMAVGLEQVVWDQKREHGDYNKDFVDTEYKLRATLCEIQVAILERNVMQHDDVTRDLMGDEFRHMGNASYRNLRDWLIFRDYMNGLEYIIEVFEYFKHKLTS